MTLVRFKMIASAYLILVKDGKLLMLRRYKTGYEDGKYSLPAGHVEDGETLAQNLCREANEEVGLTIDPKDATLVHTMHRKEEDIRMDFFFTVSRYEGEPKNCEPDKCDQLAWFPLDKLPGNTIGYIRAAVEAYRKKQIYSERGW